eukprot:364786-Chlamydomonas_euryale.AAC.4
MHAGLTCWALHTVSQQHCQCVPFCATVCHSVPLPHSASRPSDRQHPPSTLRPLLGPKASFPIPSPHLHWPLGRDAGACGALRRGLGRARLLRGRSAAPQAAAGWIGGLSPTSCGAYKPHAPRNHIATRPLRAAVAFRPQRKPHCHRRHGCAASAASHAEVVAGASAAGQEGPSCGPWGRPSLLAPPCGHDRRGDLCQDQAHADSPKTALLSRESRLSAPSTAPTAHAAGRRPSTVTGRAPPPSRISSSSASRTLTGGAKALVDASPPRCSVRMLASTGPLQPFSDRAPVAQRWER